MKEAVGASACEIRAAPGLHWSKSARTSGFYFRHIDALVGKALTNAWYWIVEQRITKQFLIKQARTLNDIAALRTFSMYELSFCNAKQLQTTCDWKKSTEAMSFCVDNINNVSAVKSLHS